MPSTLESSIPFKCRRCKGRTCRFPCLFSDFLIAMQTASFRYLFIYDPFQDAGVGDQPHLPSTYGEMIGEMTTFCQCTRHHGCNVTTNQLIPKCLLISLLVPFIIYPLFPFSYPGQVRGCKLCARSQDTTIGKASQRKS